MTSKQVITAPAQDWRLTVDEILEGQTDIFEILGPRELETQPPPINEKTKPPLAEKDTP